MASVASCLVLIVISLYTVSASNNTGNPELHCYQCNSGKGFDGPKCEAANGEADLQDYFIPCPAPEADRPVYTRCRKQVQTVEGKDSSDYRVIRSCATAGIKTPESGCIDRVGTARIKVKYCECENESPDKPCNSAYSVTSSIASVVVFAVLGRALWARV
jgi:hypothetical protein